MFVCQSLKSAEITCSDLEEPENGQILFSSNSEGPQYDIGVVVTYSCDEGFSLEDGDLQRTCVYDRRGDVAYWSGIAPLCVGKHFDMQPLSLISSIL